MKHRGLRVKSIDTCRSEHKGLQDVREGDDAPRVPVLIHQNQAMDLWVQAEHHGQAGQLAPLAGTGHPGHSPAPWQCGQLCPP